MCLGVLVEPRVSNQGSSATSIWQTLSLHVSSEVSTLLLSHKPALRPCTQICIHIDISPLPEHTQIYLCTLMVESLQLPRTPVQLWKQLQDLPSSLFPTHIKLIGFNRQDRDRITLNGQYLRQFNQLAMFSYSKYRLLPTGRWGT